MKYEPIFGDQSLFDKATRKNTVAIYKISENLTVELDKYEKLFAFLQQQPLCDRPDIAMRRIIAEPKRWTAEDQKAGMLPDVGYEYIGRDVLLTCVFVDKNRDVWGKSKDNLMYCHDYSEIKPIETPEEKAQRLRSEWISKAYVDFHRLGCELEVLQKEQIKQIYDALLSGELTMPNKDGE